MDTPAAVAEVIIQVLVTLGLASLIGLERELNAQPAGLRTHVLVALGALLFTIAGIEFGHADQSRVAAQVVSGIGFLGGGAILREGLNVRGLTTAASLWVTASVGLAVGIKAYPAAVAVVVVVLVVLVGLKYVEREFFPRRRGIEVELELDGTVTFPDLEADVSAVLGGLKVLRVTRSGDGDHVLVLRGRPDRETRITALAQRLRRLPGVVGVDVRQ